MKKALISTIEPRETGYRVAQVELEENIFETNEAYIWIDCPDHVIADSHWYNPKDKSFIDLPKPEIKEIVKFEVPEHLRPTI